MHPTSPKWWKRMAQRPIISIRTCRDRAKVSLPSLSDQTAHSSRAAGARKTLVSAIVSCVSTQQSLSMTTDESMVIGDLSALTEQSSILLPCVPSSLARRWWRIWFQDDIKKMCSASSRLLLCARSRISMCSSIAAGPRTESSECPRATTRLHTPMATVHSDRGLMEAPSLTDAHAIPMRTARPSQQHILRAIPTAASARSTASGGCSTIARQDSASIHVRQWLRQSRLRSKKARAARS